MWFSGFFFLILSLIVEVNLWWKLQASLIFLSGRTCTIGGWLNTFLPHCICSCVVLLLYNFYSLHCPLSGPDLIYISLLIIPCIIYHVTNKETLNLEPIMVSNTRAKIIHILKKNNYVLNDPALVRCKPKHIKIIVFCCLAQFPIVHHPLFQPNSFQSLIIMMSALPQLPYSPSNVYCSICVTMTQLINILLVHITLWFAFPSLSLSHPHHFRLLVHCKQLVSTGLVLRPICSMKWLNSLRPALCNH